MKTARSVAGILVKAAMAAYAPPVAIIFPLESFPAMFIIRNIPSIPQIVIAANRPPRSLAVFAATFSNVGLAFSHIRNVTYRLTATSSETPDSNGTISC
jgi:hypothetical protein